jgi:DNA-binding PadR family transcriptional regulator
MYDTNRTIVKTTTNLLKFAILCLLAEKPRSGYDLRKQFADTPMSRYSSSPGSVYPALHRLHSLELVEELSPINLTGRRKQLFQLTASGLADLTRWCRQEVTGSDVTNSLHELMLRFAFMDEIIGREQTIVFLHQLHSSLTEYVAELRSFYKTASPMMNATSRLAFELGLNSFEMQEQWAGRALETLSSPVARSQPKGRSGQDD